MAQGSLSGAPGPPRGGVGVEPLTINNNRLILIRPGQGLETGGSYAVRASVRPGSCLEVSKTSDHSKAVEHFREPISQNTIFERRHCQNA